MRPLWREARNRVHVPGVRRKVKAAMEQAAAVAASQAVASRVAIEAHLRLPEAKGTVLAGRP